MDEKTKERVHAIAKSLKDLHLVANMEEALERAREIVASAKDDGKPIKELMAEVREEAGEQDKTAEHIQKESDKVREKLGSEAHEEHKQAEHDLASAKQDKSTAKTAGEQLKFDVKVHKLEKGGVKEATQEVDDINCAVKDTAYINKEAEKIQQKERKKK